MKVKYFLPQVLEVNAEGEANLISETEIDRKISKQLDEFLIHWQQQDGVKVTARFIRKEKE